VRRREFIKALAGSAAATWAFAARAQPTVPVIGYLSTQSKVAALEQTAKFIRGLHEMGFVDGQNVAIEYRWADGQYDRLPTMAAELVRRPVNVILAQAPPAALAAKAATTTIPIVFVVGFDPIAAGLVESLSQPSGNATGMTLMTAPLGQKRIEGLRELVPKATSVAMLANPLSPEAVPEIRDAQAAARANGLELKMYNASTPVELDAAFSAIAAQHPDGLLVGSDPFLWIRRNDVVAFAARYKIPTIYPFREFADAGGLISYGTNIANAYRQAGIYVGRILKGAKPRSCPLCNRQSSSW
jgi:putative ABC transport system substrate-binding protein